MTEYYENIQIRLINIIDLYPEKNNKKMHLDLLQRIIGRMEESYKVCETCQFYQDLVEEIISKIEIDDKTYLKDMGTLKTHLLKKHHLVEEGFFMALFMSVGVFTGIILGTVLSDLPIFLGFGVSLGITIGSFIDAFAKEKNKVL
ncbi:MAG: hypothetical protein KAG94_02125 [Clostridiales bacterium]|nr:hypothetical protein [Clostridiales bacterium]